MPKIFYSFGFDSNDTTQVDKHAYVKTPYALVEIPLQSFHINNVLALEDDIRGYLKLNADLFVDDLIQSIKDVGGEEEHESSTGETGPDKQTD